jgi:hypothetical protein
MTNAISAIANKLQEWTKTTIAFSEECPKIGKQLFEGVVARRNALVNRCAFTALASSQEASASSEPAVFGLIEAKDPCVSKLAKLVVTPFYLLANLFAALCRCAHNKWSSSPSKPASETPTNGGQTPPTGPLGMAANRPSEGAQPAASPDSGNAGRPPLRTDTDASAATTVVLQNQLSPKGSPRRSPYLRLDLTQPKEATESEPPVSPRAASGAQRKPEVPSGGGEAPAPASARRAEEKKSDE